jgi:hypothetical protein
VARVWLSTGPVERTPVSRSLVARPRQWTAAAPLLLGTSRRPRAAAALLLLLGALVLPALPAQADAYRFWGYFTWDPAGATWVFAPTGPDDAVPADGSVEGWRFAVADEAATKPPRAAGDAAAICGSTPAAEGQKRVAVVLDYGALEDAAAGTGEPPAARGACAVVPEAATGSQVLAAVATVRVADGLTCGIDGWPAAGCGDPVPGAAPAEPSGQVVLQMAPAAADDETAAADEPAGGGVPWLLVGGVVAVAAVGGAAWARSRRAAVQNGEEQRAA